MEEINLIDETLDINLTINYYLTINLSEIGFTFSIFDPLRNKYIGIIDNKISRLKNLENYISKFYKVVKSNEVLNSNFKSVICTYQSNKYALIPKPIFDKDKITELYKFNNEIEDNEVLNNNFLKNSNCNIIYPLNTSISLLISNLYPKTVYYHYIQSFIENKLLVNKNKNLIKVYINISNNYFDSLVTNGNKIILSNSFDFHNNDDFIYFFLLIFEQLKLDPEETELILSGEINKEDEIFLKIKKYIKNIKFDKLDDFFSYSYIFFELKPYQYSNYLNIIKCV